MIFLGIETSCDETAASVVKDGTIILSNVVASSQKLHIKSGGIIPEIAAREQIKCLIPVMRKSLEQCNLKIENLDCLAVTIGPGLIGSLLVGVETAKTLAYLFGKPLVPIDHLIAHFYANWLNPVPNLPQQTPSFPAIGLVASGGHSDLVLLEDHAHFRWLGGTRDDAAGEAFDKIARLLGLPYPGGPAIARLVATGATKAAELGGSHKSRVRLPRPLLNDASFDFSFSGLKTAVLREVESFKKKGEFNEAVIYELAHEVQESITDVLVKKTIRAAQKYKVKSVLLGGGVSANERLREKFRFSTDQARYTLNIPPPNLCTDNAAVVAAAAYFNFKPRSWKKIDVDPGLSLSTKRDDKSLSRTYN